VNSHFSAPTCVVIDLDNTLYSYAECHKAGLEALRDFLIPKIGISVREFDGGWESARLHVKQRLAKTASSHSRLLYLEQLMSDLKLGFRPEILLQAQQTYWASYLIQMQIREGAEEFLLECRQAGIPIIILTDLTSEIQLRKIVRLGLSSLVDEVLTSEFVGSDKESMAGFDFLAKTKQPHLMRHLWFIGDGPHDHPTQVWVDANSSIETCETFEVPQTSFVELCRLLENRSPSKRPL
jgi:FMN phosphatase YigB (HAD superfamily)